MKPWVPEGAAAKGPRVLLLERITAIVLFLVLVALGWMIVAANLPTWGNLLPIEVEVIAVLVLLTAALLLVSVVALLHTRH